MASENLIKTIHFYYEVPISKELELLLHPSEQFKFAVKTIRDIGVFTNKRILIADKQGIIGKKAEYYSIPYKSIVTYSIETAGTFDLDSEIRLVLSGGTEVELKFFKGKNMNKLLFMVYHAITEYMFK